MFGGLNQKLSYWGKNHLNDNNAIKVDKVNENQLKTLLKQLQKIQKWTLINGKGT